MVSAEPGGLELEAIVAAAQRVKVPGARELSLIEFVEQVLEQVRRDHVKAFAGNLAFRGLFAIFAVLVLVFSLLAVFGAVDLVYKALEQVAPAMPRPVIESLRNQIFESTQQSSAAGAFGLGALVSTVAAVYGLSATARAVIDAMNVMYEVEERRPFFKRAIASILISLVVIALLLGAAILIVAGAYLGRRVAEMIGLEAAFRLMWSIVRWPVLAAIVALAFALVYRLAPAKAKRFRWLSHGTVTAVLLWLLFTFVFGLYVENFGSFSVTYGALAGIVVLLLYMFVSSLILLVGAEIDDVIDAQRGERVRGDQPHK